MVRPITTMAGSHYVVLQLARDCSQDDVRRAYHRAARLHHPDRLASSISLQKVEEHRPSDEGFLRIQEAYEVLRNTETRAEYDRQFAQEELCRQRDVEDVRIAEEVALREMQREELQENDGETDVVYSHQCRCGDVYEIAESELAEGVDIAPCNGCSLNIRVLANHIP